MDKTITVSYLHAALVCRNFIKGISDCNYEVYLREMVNSSSYFLKLSNGEKYCKPPSEVHGEYDCITENYSIDFKLVGSSSFLRAKNLLTGGIWVMPNGGVMNVSSKITDDNPKYKPLDATWIHVALRSKTLDDLKAIGKGFYKDKEVEKDIRAYLKKLETKKNILLFLPYEFFTEQTTSLELEIEEIISALNGDFAESLRYRKEVARQYGTAFVFLYSGYFIITCFDGTALHYVDKVHESFCPTYLELKSYTDWI